MNKINSLFKWL